MPRNLKILIVEDEEFWREKIRSILCDELAGDGYSVTIDAAQTAEAAMDFVNDCAAKGPYDLVSLDMHLAEPDGDSGHGLDVLGRISIYSAAWMVSILTGIERDDTVAASLGENLASKLQKELRSSIYKTSFPRERLMIQEKPLPEEEDILENRIRDVCSVLRQSLSGQNVFRCIELPCLVAKHELTDGTWVVKDSPEHRKAKKDKALVMAGRVARNAKWVEDTVKYRQVRYGCGALITLDEPKSLDFVAIGAALAKPGATIRGREVYGNGLVPGDGDDSGFDYEGNLSTGSGDQWDATESESRKAYAAAIEDLKARLAELPENDRHRAQIEQEIDDLAAAMKKLRCRPVAKVEKGAVDMKQAKSRAIGSLKNAGQLELAEHLENSLKVSGNTLTYDIDKDVIWNT